MSQSSHSQSLSAASSPQPAQPKAVDLRLPNGEVKSVASGTSLLEVARSLGTSVGKQAIAARLDGRPVDLSEAVYQNASLDILLPGDEDSLPIYRLSAAHLLAQAVLRRFGGEDASSVKLGIGLSTKDGFYYDFELPSALSAADLPALEREMRRIAEENLPIRRRVYSREEALAFYREQQQPYKIEMIEDAPQDEDFSFYEQGEFVDLDRGPHLPSTGRLKAFKLLSVAGAYWRGDANRPVLQRIYGTAFPRKESLDEHLQMLEEAKKRDHRKLGRELKLFMFSDEAPGMPFYLTNIRVEKKITQLYA